MPTALSSGCQTRVFYRLIEAAILWAGLAEQGARILELTAGMGRIPEMSELAPWPQLRLCSDRLYDALVNFDLPFGSDGVTSNDPALLGDPTLTIRHVDLKAWMARCYPGQRPEFLFDGYERELHPAVTLDVVRALLIDREALALRLAECTGAREALAVQLEQLEEENRELIEREQRGRAPGLRGEATYLNIIGGLLGLLLGSSPGGVAYSSFKTTDAVVSAMVAHYGDRPGISERTLWAKFSIARRQLGAQ